MAATKRPNKAKKAENDESLGSVKTSLSGKDYERELARLHVELVKLQQWVVAKGLKVVHRLRGPRRRRQGRHHQGDHRARQPARLSRGRAARADRAREVADVHAALHAASAGRRRDRDLRPQLVQPRRRRAGDGLLHRGAGEALSRADAGGREGDRRFRHHPAQILARGQRGGADAPARGAHRRSDARSGSCRRWI